MDKCRVGTRAIAAFIAMVSLPEKWAPLLFAKTKILASEGISLHKERNLNLRAELWQALERWETKPRASFAS
jgi:hypothetical protein